ncbi:class I SAM-dependent methyltransferase [Caenispirillum bisanense]|uniref:SAM-dependent methyltransferase, MidA family n=1 Tax=Caenispirillum bisanense TaxID=414052 RepID=A0A286GJG9_9PROT|nr:SAM-dependent methyltransferase [Caenispirillum bisanense]SOD95134.1 SAM-dependent methyltransferase, MidA family [Caenispirillum bisanense]
MSGGGTESDIAAVLRDRIRAAGSVPFEEFMGEAIAAYYGRGDVFGRDGDFTTAPEISQMFGEILGLWCAVAWQLMGKPARIALVELGPGRGTLMCDMLRASRLLPPFRAALSVHLVERSLPLRRLQERALAPEGVTPVWHDHVADLPADVPLLVVANEFFDALPVRQVMRTPDAWHERHVTLNDDGAFAFTLGPAVPDAEVPAAVGPCRPGSIVELCPAGRAIGGELAARLARQGGVGLVLDYGYVRSAAGDSVQALKRHAYHPVLADVGQVDLTAHVDFQALGDAAATAGARVQGPVTQGAFLTALGINQRAEVLAANAAPQHAEDVHKALHRLIDPAEMGTLFKVLALAHPALPTLPGFEGSTSA